jgi:hypothetical protein
MADKRIQRIIQLIFDERAAAKAERQAQASLKRATGGGSASFIRGIGRGLSDIARLGIQAAASITGYAVALSRMVERGGEVINVQRAFTSLFGNQPAAIDKLRKATMGLVSDYDLMKEANMALSLGAARNIDDFGKIAAASIKLGRALGVDANKAMHDLSIGIARGSKRILDNLGIIVDGAITVEKVMEAVDVRVESLGGAAETGADALLRLKISFINLKDAVAVFLANNRQLQIWFRELGGMTDALALTLKHAETGELKEAFKHFGTIMGTIFIQAFLIAVKKAIEHAGPLGGFLLGGGLGALGGGLAGPGGAVVGSAIGGMAGAGLFHGLPKDFQGLIDDHSTVINAEIAALGAMRKEMEERRKKFARMGIHGDRPAALPPPDLEALEEARQAEDSGSRPCCNSTSCAGWRAKSGRSCSTSTSGRTPPLKRATCSRRTGCGCWRDARAQPRRWGCRRWVLRSSGRISQRRSCSAGSGVSPPPSAARRSKKSSWSNCWRG